MPFRLTYEVDGVVMLDRAFNRVGEHLNNLIPVWNRLEPVLEDMESEQFLSEGAAGLHGKWAPLSPRYAKYKEFRWPGRPILQRDYHLVSSLTDKTSDSIRVKEKDEFAFGTKVKSKSGVDYPLLHQRGTRRLPARRVIDFSDSQKRTMQKEVQAGLLELLRSDPSVRSMMNFD
jgi:phage gpG-like protein